MHLWLSVLVQIVHKFMQGLQILRNRITYSKTKGIYSKRLSTWCRRINTCHEEYSWSQGQMHLSLLSTVHLARQRHAHIWWTDVRCPSIPRVCMCVFVCVCLVMSPPKDFCTKNLPKRNICTQSEFFRISPAEIITIYVKWSQWMNSFRFCAMKIDMRGIHKTQFGKIPNLTPI